MNKAIAGVVLAFMTASLIACGDGKRDGATTMGNAEGEILERSASDDMLPYDTLRSQPPLAEPEKDAKPGASGNAADTSSGQSAAIQPSEEATEVVQPRATTPVAE